MVAVPAFLLRHTVSVEAFLGDGPFGPTFDDPVDYRVFVDETTRMVRTTTADQVASSATVIGPLDMTCPVGSRVTLPTGRVATALVTDLRDAGGLPTPDHLQVALT